MAQAPGPPAVLLVVRAPEAEPARPELAHLLGREGYVALERLLIARALDWAETVAAGRVHIAAAPAHGVAAVSALAVGRAVVRPLEGSGASSALSAATDRVFAEAGGPVFVAWPDLPRWRRAHAEGALLDLRAGCDVSVGPVFDGGFYLLALARPVPALFSIPDATWRSPEAMGAALAAAHGTGLDAGLLRAERGLHRVADVRAVLADPLVDDDLAAVLRAPR